MILVTGATGLVGSQICRLLKEKSIEFRALKRETSKIPSELIDENWFIADILDDGAMLEAMEGVTTIIHAAAMISFYHKDNKQMELINVQGTNTVINAALKSSVTRILHISSIAALGRSKSDIEINENTQWTYSQNNTYYSETKYLAELEVWRGLEEGLSVTVVNPSIILGIGDWTTSSTRLFKYAFDEHRFFPSGSMNYVDNRDVASLVIALINSPSGERYILNGGNVSYENFFSIAALSFGKKPPVKKISKNTSMFILVVAKIQSILTGRRPFVTREALLSSKKNYQYDASKIKKLMNFAFRDFEDTVAWVCAGLKKD